MSIYQQLKEQNVLPPTCLALAEFIEGHQDAIGWSGSVSQLDAQRIMEPDTNRQHSTIRPRFYDLEAMGVIERVGKKHDPFCNRQVIGYRMTGRLANERVKERGVRTLLREALLQLEPASTLAHEIRDRLKIAA